MVTRKHDNREVMWVRANELTPIGEGSYGRPINSTRVRKIAENFDSDALGVLEVSEREDGVKIVIDGNHRLTAINLMGWGDQLVPVIVHSGLSVKEEARIFRIRNKNAVLPRPMDLYRSDIVEGNPDALAIQAVVENLGLYVSTDGKAGAIAAISSLYKVYHRSGSLVLGKVLKTIRDAWGKDRHNFNAEFIKALALFYTRYGYANPDKRLMEILRRTNIDALISQSHARRAFTSFSTSTALVLVLVDQYNQRLKNPLPQWVFVHESMIWKSHQDLVATGYGAGAGQIHEKVKRAAEAKAKPKKGDEDQGDDADAA